MFGGRGRQILDEARQTYQNLIRSVKVGASEPEVMETLTRNLETPISQPLLEEIGIGTVEQQMSRYKAFDTAYRRAVADELRLGVANEAKRNLLNAALNPNTEINLNLISNTTVRNQLREQFHFNVLQVGDLIDRARNARFAHAINKCPGQKIRNVFNLYGWRLQPGT